MSAEKDQALESLVTLLGTCKTTLNTLASSSHSTPNVGSVPTVEILRKDALSLHRLIYTSTTRLSVSLGKLPPSYSIALVPLKDLASQVAQLASCTSSFSSSVLRKEAIWAAEETISAVETLTQHFETRCRRDDVEGDEYLAKTGAVHEAVVRAEKLSNNEIEAIVKVWKVNGEGLEDSLKEVKGMMEDEGDDAEAEDDGWEELGEGFGGKLQPEEMARVHKIYPLLRFTTLLHGKLLSHILTPSPSQPYSEPHMNSLVTFSNSLFLATDDLASALYAPQDVENIQEAAQLVHQLTADLDRAVGVTEMDCDKVTDELAGLHLGSGSQTLTWFKKCFSQINTIYAGLSLSK